MKVDKLRFETNNFYTYKKIRNYGESGPMMSRVFFERLLNNVKLTPLILELNILSIKKTLFFVFCAPLNLHIIGLEWVRVKR